MVNKNISHYRVVGKLDEGGMGEVYLAEDLKLKRKTALKFLSSSLVNDEEKIRFINEARAAASLNHPNICTVYEVDEDEGKPFISMEYIEGDSLTKTIKESEHSLDKTINIILQIADGLREAANNGIIHRDIKTANILFTKSGQSKITDFGLAKFKGAPNITKNGATVGTVAYMSPEQTRGEEVDSTTDIWSLGVVFYEMLTGKLPFRGDFDQAIIYSILNEDPIPFNKSIREIPQKLQDIVLKMLMKETNERYQSFNEVIEDLRIFAEESGISLHPNIFSSNRNSHKIKLVKIGVPVIFPMLCLLIYFTLWKTAPKEVNVKLCVFPFETIGTEEDDQVIQGLYTDLVNRLGFINGLSIVPPKIARDYYKKTNVMEALTDNKIDYWIAADAQLVFVDSIKNIKVNIRIVDTEKEKIVWNDQIIREMSSLFEFYGDFAEHIARNLDLEILAEKRLEIVKARTINPEANEYYLKYRELLRRAQANPSVNESIRGHDEAISWLEKAAKIDSTNYRWFSRLFRINCFVYFQYDKSEERKRKTFETLRKAKQLAPEYAMDWIRGAEARFYYQVERDYEKAYKIWLELNKKNPEQTRFWLSMIDLRMGNFNKIVETMTSNELNDGDSPAILGDVYLYLRKYRLADKMFDLSHKNQKGFIAPIKLKAINQILWTGDVDAAISIWEKVESDSVNEKNYIWLKFLRFKKEYNELIDLIRYYKDEYTRVQLECFLRPLELSKTYFLMDQKKLTNNFADSAVVVLKQKLLSSPNDELLHAAIGISYALAGDRENALHHGKLAIKLRSVDSDAIDGPIYEQYLAEIYAILGMKKEAIEKLKYLLSIPSYVSKEYLKIDPLYDNLRNEDQFKRLISD